MIRTVRELAAVLLAVLSCSGCFGSGCGPDPGPPPADECDDPMNVPLEELEIGPGNFDEPFVAWQDGDPPTIEMGGQGSDMLRMKIRVRGATNPTCLDQRTTVRADGRVIGLQSTPLSTYEDTAGKRVTKTMYQVLSGDGSELTVTVEAGGLTTTRTLRHEGAPDAAVRDGGSPDAAEPPGRTNEPPFVPLAFAPGSGLAPGLVTGRIYGELANPTGVDRMLDFGALGVRVLRLEIELGTAWSVYQTIARRAREEGMELLAVVSANSLPAGTPLPMAGTRNDFDNVFVAAYLGAIDEVRRQLPEVRFVEVWNQPDVTSFTPFVDTSAGCVAAEGSYRYALLATRVFEAMNERRRLSIPTPTLVAFGISRADDACVRTSLFDAPPIASHRSGYRQTRALADGLPTDIIGMHGHGVPGKLPHELGYTSQGGTFADGVSAFLATKFADNASVVGTQPVWVTEVASCREQLMAASAEVDQAAALTSMMNTLAGHAQITAAFWYDYRDDAFPGTRACGLRKRDDSRVRAYQAFATSAARAPDLVAPQGQVLIESPQSDVWVTRAAVSMRGWAIDADGVAPRVDLLYDGRVVLPRTATGVSTSCGLSGFPGSSRCPDIAFSFSLEGPAAAGPHEIAVRLTDAAGNYRVIERRVIEVR